MKQKNRKPYWGKILIMLVILASIILISITTTYVKEPKEEAPLCEDCNIILIVVDALRQDHVGTYGYYRNTTPNIDRLAEKSYVFQNAISHASLTKPSIATLFTSTYPLRHQTYYHLIDKKWQEGATILPNSFTTIAEKLSQNGYKTYGMVNNVFLDPKFNLNQGFDEYKHIRSDIQNTQQIKEILLNSNTDEKFFIYLHYLGSHAPYNPPKEYSTFFNEDHHKYIDTRGKHQQHYQSLNITSRQLGYIISQYDREILSTDNRIGELLTTLKDRGIMDKTIVIITADHGESFNDGHGNFGHGHRPYETQIRIPLIIYIPGYENQTRDIETQIGLIDIAPTIFNLTAIDIPPEMDGTNMVPLLNDGHMNRTLFIDRIVKKSTIIGLRQDNWKYIYTIDDGQEELYDLSVDPYELNEIKGLEEIKEDFHKRVMDHYMINLHAGNKVADRSKIKLSNKIIKRLQDLGYVY